MPSLSSELGWENSKKLNRLYNIMLLYDLRTMRFDDVNIINKYYKCIFFNKAMVAISYFSESSFASVT